MPEYSFPGISPLKNPTPRRGAAQSRSGSNSGKQGRKPRLLLIFGGLILAGALIVALLGAYAVIFMKPRLPSLDAITNYQPKVPLRIYSADHVLMGEFGEEKRSLVKLNEIPADMKNAVLAIEDARFYQHGGGDYVGFSRALLFRVVPGGV